MSQEHQQLRLNAAAVAALCLAFGLAAPGLSVAQTAPAPAPASAASPAPLTGKELFKQGDKTWEITVSPYTYHWSEDPAHKRVGLVGLERHNAADHSLWGFALFPNSFGQNSAYGYYGHEFNDVFGVNNLYIKVSAGLIYGYRDQYEDKVPFNYHGFAPVIIPGIGYRLTPQDAVQVAVLGTAGVMFMYSRSF